MQSARKICFHYQKGSCKFGEKCNNIHDATPQNGQPQLAGNNQNFGNTHFNNSYGQNPNPHKSHNPHNNHSPYMGNKPQHPQKIPNHNPNFGNKSTNSKMSICKYFVGSKGCSKGESCSFLHNYHQTLHHISRETIMDSNIAGLAATCIF